MFLIDSLMISGLRWTLETVAAAADAEMNDDTALREQLLEAEMRREVGEITEEEFADVEATLLARIREIKERREGGGGPFAMGGQPLEAPPGGRLAVEASVSGEFHQPFAADPPASPAASGSPAGRPAAGARAPHARRRTRKSGPGS